MRSALVVMCLVVGGPAHADETNRNMLPLGEREALLANAGNTSASGGAAFYNPANLVWIEHASISMSGTTLLRFEISTDALYVVEGVDQPFHASGFMSVPASLVSTYKLGGWSAATAVLVPDAFEISNRVTTASGETRTTLLQKVQRQDLWIGGSLARPITDGLAIGLSVFGAKRAASSLQMVQIRRPAASETVQSLTSTDASALGLTAVAGVSWQPSDRVRFGARVQTPLLRLGGSIDIYQSTITTGAMDDVAIAEYDDVKYTAPLPWDVGGGVLVRPVPHLDLMADVNVQLPASYKQILDDALSPPTITLETAVRASIAAEIQVTDGGSRIQVGLSYNGSAAPTPRNEGDVRESYVGATAGFSWQSKRTRTGLGAFYMRSNGDLVPAGTPGRTVGTTSNLIGALITVAYNL